MGPSMRMTKEESYIVINDFDRKICSADSIISQNYNSLQLSVCAPKNEFFINQGDTSTAIKSANCFANLETISCWLPTDPTFKKVTTDIASNGITATFYGKYFFFCQIRQISGIASTKSYLSMSSFKSISMHCPAAT